MDKRTRRLINFLKTKYRDDPEGFRALLPGSADVSPGPASHRHPQPSVRPVRRGARLPRRAACGGAAGAEGGQAPNSGLSLYGTPPLDGHLTHAAILCYL